MRNMLSTKIRGDSEKLLVTLPPSLIFVAWRMPCGLPTKRLLNSGEKNNGNFIYGGRILIRLDKISASVVLAMIVVATPPLMADDGFSPYVDEQGNIRFPAGFRTSMVHLGSWFVPKEPGNWAYFTFSHESPPYPKAAKLQPAASCNMASHHGLADDDWVFTQDYPVLRVAKGKGM